MLLLSISLVSESEFIALLIVPLSIFSSRITDSAEVSANAKRAFFYLDALTPGLFSLLITFRFIVTRVSVFDVLSTSVI